MILIYYFFRSTRPPKSYIIGWDAKDQHIDEIVKIIKPQGRFGLIDDPKNLNVMPFKAKAVSIHINGRIRTD